MINEKIANDGFLGALHIMMFMDDTVLLSETREGLISKFKTCQDFCYEYGMSVNESRTKFMVTNGGNVDKLEVISNDVRVDYCKNYEYLGAPISDDGLYATIIDLHVKDEHVIEFYTFLSRNPGLPFFMKKRVAESCLISNLLYGCETWFCSSCGKLTSLYMRVIKAILNTEDTTCNEIPTLKSRVEIKMKRYFKNKLPVLDKGDPLKIAKGLVNSRKTKSPKIIKNIFDTIENIEKR